MNIEIYDFNWILFDETSVSLARLAFPFLQLSAATSPFFGVKIFCMSKVFAAWTKLMEIFHKEHPINVFFAGMALLLLKLFKNFRLAQEVFPLQQHKQWGGRKNSYWESFLTILPSVWPPVLLRPLPTGHMCTKTVLRPPQGTGTLLIKSQNWTKSKRTAAFFRDAFPNSLYILIYLSDTFI